MIAWLKQFGLLEDETVNVMFLDGRANETVSLHAADEEHTAIWARLLCALLSVIVQRHHCAKQRAGLPMSAPSYVRAGVALTILLSATAYGLHALWSFL